MLDVILKASAEKKQHMNCLPYPILFNIILTYTVSSIMISAMKYAYPGAWAGAGLQH